MSIIKRILCGALCLVTVASLWACSDVDLEGGESDTSDASEAISFIESTEEESSEAESSTETVSAPESSEEKELVYTPVYPEDYELRVNYYKNLEIGYDLEDSFFNNSVFVGNSIMYHFDKYVSAKRAADPSFLGKAYFFAGPSFSFYNNKHQTPDSPDCALPSFRGNPMTIIDAVEEMNVGTVYLSLMALNDIAIYRDSETGINETYNLVTALIEEIKGKGVKVVVLSNTYLHASSDRAGNKLNNGSISTLNIRVLDYCNLNGIDFIDIASVLLTDEGALGDVFCSDIGSASFACHLTEYSYNAWTEILRDYADKKQNGTWINPTSMKGLMPAA